MEEGGGHFQTTVAKSTGKVSLRRPLRIWEKQIGIVSPEIAVNTKKLV